MKAASLLLDLSPLRSDPRYRRLWPGHTASEFGRQMTIVALPFQVYSLTGSPLAIAGLAVVQLLPILVFSLLGGALADRVDRRRLLLATQAGMVATTGALAVLTWAGDVELWALYLLAAAVGAVGAIDRPARKATLFGLIPPAKIPAAAALDQAGTQLSSVAGPVLTGLLAGFVGLAAAYALNAATYLVLAVALLRVGPLPVAGATVDSAGVGSVRATLGSIADGLRYVGRTRAIAGSMLMDLNAMTFGWRLALFPVLAIDVFRIGAPGLGLLSAAPACGALAATILGGYARSIRRPGVALTRATLVWGAAIGAAGLATFSLPLTLVLLAVAGAADVVSAVLRATITYSVAPDELRGRTAALQMMTVTSGPRLGDLQASAVAALASAPFAMVSGGILCIAGTLAIARAFPQILDVAPPAGRPPETLTAATVVSPLPD